jgi:hypothetical protein
MNKTLFLPLIIVFFTFYYFLFPREGGAEFSLMPDQAWMLSSDIPQREDLVISRGAQKALFFENGDTPFLPVPVQNAVLTEDFYLYREGKGFVLKDLERGEQYPVAAEGQALIRNSRIYIVDLWKGRIQEYDPRGERLWSWQALGPITAFDAGEGATVLGLLDGSVQIFDNNGLRREIVSDEVLQDGIIYGLSLSPGGDRLSVLSGLEEQRVVEYELETLTALGEPRVLESRFSRPVRMSYSPDGQLLWVEQEDKLVQFGPEDELLEIPQEGRLMALGSMDGGGQLMVLTEERRKSRASTYLMNFYTREGALVGSLAFSNPPDDIVLKDDRVYFSSEGRILKIARRKS